MRPLVIAPGTVAANTDISIPGRLHKITAARKFTGSDGTNAADSSALTVATQTPGAGEIWLSAEGTVQLGDALTGRNVVIIQGVAIGETVQRTVKYIGA